MGDLSEALAALKPFPVVQSTVALLMILGAIYIAFRATRDKPPLPPPLPPPELFPQWLMMGPMHDMMQSVHEVAEEARRTNDLLREIKDIMGDMLRQSEMAKATLEAIRNESRLR
jgi:hypothetical protein